VTEPVAPTDGPVGALSDRLAALVGAAAPGRPGGATPGRLDDLSAQVRELDASLAALRTQLADVPARVVTEVRGAVDDALAARSERAAGDAAVDVSAQVDERADALEDRLSTVATTLGVTVGESQAAPHALAGRVDTVAASIMTVTGELVGLEERLGRRVDEAALAVAEAIVALLAGAEQGLEQAEQPSVPQQQAPAEPATTYADDAVTTPARLDEAPNPAAAEPARPRGLFGRR